MRRVIRDKARDGKTTLFQANFLRFPRGIPEAPRSLMGERRLFFCACVHTQERCAAVRIYIRIYYIHFPCGEDFYFRQDLQKLVYFFNARILRITLTSLAAVQYIIRRMFTLVGLDGDLEPLSLSLLLQTIFRQVLYIRCT